MHRLAILFAAAGLVCGCGKGGAGPSSPAIVGSATLNWSPPGRNQDGTPVGDIAGYYIYYGTKAAQLDHVVKVPNPELSRFEIRDLPAGTYYFSMRAYTSAGAAGLS